MVGSSCLQLFKDFKATHDWHLKVKEKQVCTVFIDIIPSIDGVRKSGHVAETDLLKHPAKQQDVRRLIVNDDDVQVEKCGCIHVLRRPLGFASVQKEDCRRRWASG